MTSVTVITASYNSLKYLRDTIDSVVAQTMPPAEHIIVDDDSTDGSYEFAIELSENLTGLKLIKHDVNKGYPSALNTAISQVKTDYLAILDSDDIAFPCWLEETCRVLDENPDVGLVGGGAVIMTEGGVPTGEVKCTRFKGDVTEVILDGKYAVLHPGTVMRSELIRSIGGYHEYLKSAEDKDMFINMASESKIVNVGKPLIYYRRLRASESKKTDVYYEAVKKYFLNKVSLLKEGRSVREIDEILKGDVTALQDLPRTRKPTKGEYDLEMAISFASGGKYMRSLFFLIRSSCLGKSPVSYFKFIAHLNLVKIHHFFKRG